MTTRRKFLFVGLCCSLLASCGPPPELPTYPDIHFTSKTPIELAASQIDIVNKSRQTAASRAYPVTPAHAMENWAHDRLHASGHGNPARFIFRATATQKKLPVKGGISGAFTDQASEEYDVTVDATLKLLDSHGMTIRSVHVMASRSHAVLQSASPNDRDKARYELVKAVMAAFDRQMQKQIRNNFGLYLLSR